MMKKSICFALLIFVFASCRSVVKKHSNTTRESSIESSNERCSGTYTGPEFIDGSDIAHQFSNKMSAAVGNQLKKLYAEEYFVMVDFEKISMTTEGMGSGTVTYTLDIPFRRVHQKCDAFTSFDHVGGWNHSPDLLSRKQQLQKALLHGDRLYISELKTTRQGLQEYWIQWRNKTVQSDCQD